MKKIMIVIIAMSLWLCTQDTAIKPDHILTADQKHNKFSKLIPPVLTVPSGAVIKAETNEASDGQLHAKAELDDLINIDFGPIHPLTGPVYVEEAEVGDILAVDVLKIDVQGYEDKVLKGAISSLGKKIYLVELEIIFIDYYEKKKSFLEIEEILNPYGFELYSLTTPNFAENYRIKWVDALYINKNLL